MENNRNDWIEWNGGECPVPKGMLVDVKLRDGAEFDNQFAQANDGSSWAGSAYWRHDGVPYDIIAWRLHQPEPAAWDGEGLPTLGTIVDIIDIDERLRYGQNESGEVLAHVENTAVVRMSYGLGCFEAEFLRPIRTEAERKRLVLEDARAVCNEYARRVKNREVLTYDEIMDWSAHTRIIEDSFEIKEENPQPEKLHDHACTPCFTGNGECLGDCHVSDVNRDFDAAAAVIQEYFPNGGRDWDNVESLVKAICLGKIPGVNFRPGTSVDPYKGLDEAAKPLMKWIAENCNPHSTVIVDGGSAVLYSAENSVITDEFIKD